MQALEIKKTRESNHSYLYSLFPLGSYLISPGISGTFFFKQNNLKWFKNTALIKKVMAPVYLVSWLITEVSRGWLPSQKLLACSLYLCPFPSSSPPFSSLSLSVSEWGTENIMCQDKLHSEIGHRHKKLNMEKKFRVSHKSEVTSGHKAYHFALRPVLWQLKYGYQSLKHTHAIHLVFYNYGNITEKLRQTEMTFTVSFSPHLNLCTVSDNIFVLEEYAY